MIYNFKKSSHVILDENSKNCNFDQLHLHNKKLEKDYSLGAFPRQNLPAPMIDPFTLVVVAGSAWN